MSRTLPSRSLCPTGRAGSLPGSVAVPSGEPTVAWLPPYRWASVAGQVVTVVFAELALGMDLPIGPVSLLIVLTALSNVAVLRYVRAGHSVSPRQAGGLLVLDTLLLTGLFYFCGGHSNPFTALYLLDITLAAVVLGASWTSFLAALSIACYASLFVWHAPLAETMSSVYAAHGEGGQALVAATPFQAMFIAFTVAAVLTSVLIVRLSRAMEISRAALDAMRERALRSDQIAAVTTLAAGAAHELGSPLATIAVAASELTRKLQAAGGEVQALASDARLIRSEVERCRTVLDRLAAEGGEIAGEELEAVPAAVLLQEVKAVLGEAEAARMVVLREAPGTVVLVPRRALVRTLRDLVRNGIDASPRGGPVLLRARNTGEVVLFEIQDLGPGMSAETLARIGEPFYSTKLPGHGIGLGLFLARVLCERLDWRLNVESAPGSGTVVTIEIPKLEQTT